MKPIFAAVRLAAITLCLVAVFLLRPTAAHAATPVCGTVGSGPWTLANSPYQVCASGADIPAGATVTVEPGVLVQFASGAGDRLSIEGALIATGTPTQPITFTAAVTTPTPGTWYGLYTTGNVVTPAVVSLDNTRLEYGGINGSFGAALYADQAVVTVTRSFVGYSNGNGLYLTNTAKFSVRSTTFFSNTLNAVQLNTPSVDLLMTGLSAGSNGTNAVRVAGISVTWPGQRRWTNPGIPYVIDGQISNTAGDLLTIDPGSQLIFGAGGFINIGGALKALGTDTAPITMTGQTQSAGAWRGLTVYGGTLLAAAELDYVTLEYGGSDINGANVLLQNGTLTAHNSTIRYSSKDGIRINSNAGVSILNSQIYGNALDGIRNGQPTRAVLASSDWWGAASGPGSDVNTCATGAGDKVTAGVLFNPVLTSGTITSPLPLNSAPTLTLTPRRWFAPADNVTKVYFDVSLHDGNGLPLAGRTVRLSSTLGTVSGPSVTDAFGRALLSVVSPTTGDATVTATLDPLTSCDAALSPTSKVTFTTPVADVDLMPGPAGYATGSMWLSPLPVVVGVPTTIYARLTNPLTRAVTVDVDFGYAQSGIGLTFGPIGSIAGTVIPGGGSVVLSAQFVPPVSGHYCAQVSYNITAIAAQTVVVQARQLKQFNWNAQPPTTSSQKKDAGLQQTRDALKNVNRFVGRAYNTGHIALPLALANQGISWDLNNAEKISSALQGDPPRQDYTLVDTPHVLELPPTQPGTGISAARAAALNALDDALAQANAYGTAATTAFDRSGGAAAAGNLLWQSVQTNLMQQYNQLMGTALITAATDIDNLLSVAASEGDTSVVISASDVISMQQSLAGGFTAPEIADAHAVGLTDADIEALRQSILAANPSDLAGDLVPRMQAIAAQFRALAPVLINPQLFVPLQVVGAGVASTAVTAAATTNNLAQVFGATTTIQVFNPLGTAALITLQPRAVGLPADWSVSVSPAQVNLNPGQIVTATVSLAAGAPLAQGSLPQVAIEGYSGGQLLGGVVVQVLVPANSAYGSLRFNYLPLVER